MLRCRCRATRSPRARLRALGGRPNSCLPAALSRYPGTAKRGMRSRCSGGGLMTLSLLAVLLGICADSDHGDERGRGVGSLALHGLRRRSSFLIRGCPSVEASRQWFLATRAAGAPAAPPSVAPPPAR